MEFIFIKKIIENFEVKPNKQPRANIEIYDYNLEQALQIWNDAGCSNGSYKPTRRNRRIWAHENWRKEVATYVREQESLRKNIIGMIMFQVRKNSLY